MTKIKVVHKTYKPGLTKDWDNVLGAKNYLHYSFLINYPRKWNDIEKESNKVCNKFMVINKMSLISLYFINLSIICMNSGLSISLKKKKIRILGPSKYGNPTWEH